MFSIHDRPYRLCDGISRRELLRIGGLCLGSSAGGLSLPRLLSARQGAPNLSADPTFGRAKNVIFLFLAGGPPQHETFDPKPLAPAEIRGPFKAISTNVPGIHFCELLPRTARVADKLAIIRSMSTDDNIHSSSGHWVLTGNKYTGPNARMIQPTDWPYFGSIIKQQIPGRESSALSTVWIPDIFRLNENVTPAGQTGGLLGRQWDPDHFTGDPSAPDYRVDQFQMRGISPMRLRRRMELLQQVEQHFKTIDQSRAVATLGQFQEQAFNLLTSGQAREAFAIHKEPDRLRQRYGRNRWGQCVLLARRLIEAGVRLVHVQWPREPGDNAVDNPLWDTHAQNADRLEDVLCPQFDVGFSALVEDLDQRGLLAETLVVAIGEFGRTPKINSKGGRDHWGPVFSCALAGAGIAGGQVFGASDQHGAYPAEDKVEPGHLTATIFHLLGIDPHGTFQDRQGRLHRLTARPPIHKLLGMHPATVDRTKSTGDVARVPPYDPDRRLANTNFSSLRSIANAAGPVRPKGWRGAPVVLESPEDDRLGVKLVTQSALQTIRDESGKIEGDTDSAHVAIGFNLGTGQSPITCEPESTAYLAQEVRSPFAGNYRLTIQACGEASSRKFYDNVFLKHFRFRMVFFELAQPDKNVADRTELAAVEFHPSWCAADKLAFQSFALEKNFFNPTPGGNFSFGLGLGVAVLVERIGSESLKIPADGVHRASLRIAEVRLDFDAKPRLDSVKV